MAEEETPLAPLATFTIKATTGFHENGWTSLTGVYQTTNHMDCPSALRFKKDPDGILQNLGTLDGMRLLGGIGSSQGRRNFEFNSKSHGRIETRIRAAAHTLPSPDEERGFFDMGAKWCFGMNGNVRERKKQGRLGYSTRVYHRGSSTGGACFNLIITLTRDLNESETKWMATEYMKCISSIEDVFDKY